MKGCKSKGCQTPEGGGLEASGYCFTHAEELAYLLAQAQEEFGGGFDPADAWEAPKEADARRAPKQAKGK